MRNAARQIFSFPDPVDETSARLVATGVVAMGVAFVVVGEGWLLAPLVYGFAARMASGPTLSPLGQLVTRAISPRVPGEHRPVPGRPKRFAQAIGLVVSGSAAVAWLAGAPWLTYALIGVLLAAASLEAFAGVCVGCIVYRFLWECEECADISERLRRSLEDRATAAAGAASSAATH